MEAITNSRFLTAATEVRENNLLTPNYLLHLKRDVAPYSVVTNFADNNSQKGYKGSRFLANQCRKQWLLEYPCTIFPEENGIKHEESFLLVT